MVVANPRRGAGKRREMGSVDNILIDEDKVSPVISGN
jgi:hypothetical protein